jgi:polar amino acid transport system substrate-binding protein
MNQAKTEKHGMPNFAGKAVGAIMGICLASGNAAAATTATGSTELPYTQAQAKAGKTVYSGQCASCHGANLQGVAAPAIAGKNFLKTAQSNKWSLQTIDQIVTNNMPFSAPGSLTAKQYADVMAYLLAANCYKSGNKPFPSTAPKSFAKIQLVPFTIKNAKADSNGVCPVD